MSLRVHRISAGARLEDGGRPGWKHVGVPIGGAFDRTAVRLGNALLGNADFAPAIEMTLLGGLFEATADLDIACTGAEASVKVARAVAEQHRVLRLRVGETLEVGPALRGVRTYLCVRGGFRGKPKLGSVSGREVAAGQDLEVEATPPWPERPSIRLDEGERPLSKLGLRSLRAIPADPFGGAFGEELFGEAFTVSINSDRVGVRLERLDARPDEERWSEPLCVGAIQAAPSGELLVIGPDGPTIGGYPKVGYVCEADCDAVAQLAPGSRIQFEALSLEDATAVSRSQRVQLERALDRIRGLS